MTCNYLKYLFMFDRDHHNNAPTLKHYNMKVLWWFRRGDWHSMLCNYTGLKELIEKWTSWDMHEMINSFLSFFISEHWGFMEKYSMCRCFFPRWMTQTSYETIGYGIGLVLDSVSIRACLLRTSCSLFIYIFFLKYSNPLFHVPFYRTAFIYSLETFELLLTFLFLPISSFHLP